MATNPFSHPKLKWDLSKFPDEIRNGVTPAEFLLILRAMFDHALARARNHDIALEATYQSLYHLTTDRRWNPATGETLRSHCLGLVLPTYRKLRHGSPDEKRACAVFAHERGRTCGSPEDVAIRVEDEPQREYEDDMRLALGEGVLAAIAHHDVARRVAQVWAERGYVPPREIALELGVRRSAVYNAIDLIRYHAEKIRRNQGDRQ